MQVETIVEQPIFTLNSRSYNGAGDTIQIYADDLRCSDVGTCWSADDTGNCGRDCQCMSIEIVYKSDDGCAVLRRLCGTSDDPDPEEWFAEPELIWVELHRTEEVGT